MNRFLPIRSPGYVVLLLVTFVAFAQATPPSFPGAQGFGSVTTGGRGGSVVYVTNLNDSGTGSFRSAVGGSNQIVEFAVGGYVHLFSPVSTGNNLTIAGQTAPGQGFGVYGAEVSFYGRSNCIVRGIRFRDGSLDPNWPGQTGTNSSTNCINLGDTNDMIFDHCSLEFAAYNDCDAVNAPNLTIQNCIIADPIKYQQFDFHWQGGPATFIDNIWANSHNRNPLAKGNMQYVNNVIYNFQSGITTGNSAGHFYYDIINNYFISGPSTTGSNEDYDQVDGNQYAYATGNLLNYKSNGVLNGTPANTVNNAQVLTSYYFGSTSTFPTQNLPTVDATTAVQNALANAGALPRDPVDAQVVSQVASFGSSGQLFNTQADTGLSNDGYGTITGGAAPVDSDGDGMPDYWETALGFNPNSATDGPAQSSDGSGFTNVEEYLNWMAGPHGVVQKNTTANPNSLQIDLSQYTTGLTSPTYTVSAISTGTAILPLGIGHSTTTNTGTITVSGSIATYTPAANTIGLGGFSFTATAANGTITSTVYVCTTSTAQPISVTWIGDGSANSWDDTNTNNTVWSNGVGKVAWTQGDTATFNDSGSESPPINLANPISAGNVTISTVNNYTLGGAGSLGGAMNLTFNGFGTGSLTFTNTGIATTFSGSASITDGTVTVDNYNSLGSGVLTLNNATMNIGGYNLYTSNSSIVVLSPSTINMNSANSSSTTTLNGISGSSPLTLNLQGVTFTIGNSMTGFTSTLNVNGPGYLRFNNSSSWGVPNSSLVVGNGVVIENRSGGAATIPLGSLSGPAGTQIYGSTTAPSGTAITYTIGSLNQSTTFGGWINQGGDVVSITKTGTGTLTLSGTAANNSGNSSNYTGATTVSGGTLSVTGTLGNTPVSVASGCSLTGTGTIGSTSGGAVTMQAASTTTTLSPGSAAGHYGTLTVGNGLTLNSTTIPLNLSSNSSGNNDGIKMQGGTLTLSGTSTLQLNLVNGALGAGTYYLISGGSSTSGSVSNLSSNLPSGTRQTLTLGVPSGNVTLTVSGSAAPLIWTGANNSGTWDLDTTTNWTNSNAGGAASLFYNLDNVTFNDTSSNGTVTISGTLEPASITVTNTNTNYTLGGSGLISGLATLVKSGTGSLTISNTGTNTFTGGTTISAGTLYASSSSSLGSGTITLNGGTLTNTASILTGNTVNVTAPSTWNLPGGSSYWGGTLTGNAPLTLNIGGTLSPGGNGWTYASTLTISGSLRLNQTVTSMGGSSTAFNLTSSAYVYNEGPAETDITINMGSLAGASGSYFAGSSNSGPAIDSLVVGALNTSTTYSGVIADGGATIPHQTALTKIGTGTLTLTGTETYTGSTVVEGGTLILNGGSINSGGGSTVEVTAGSALILSSGVLNADTIQVDAGGTLAGGGSLNAGVNITNNGVITANSGGTFTMTGNVTNNGTLTLTNGTTLSATGTFINNGTLDLRQGGQTLPPNLVNNGTVLLAPLPLPDNDDIPTMPPGGLALLALLLLFAATTFLSEKRSG